MLAVGKVCAIVDAPNFAAGCKLPPDWEAVVKIELLTGCSHCGKRLITDGKVDSQVTVIRVYCKETNKLEAAFVVCKDCTPN